MDIDIVSIKSEPQAEHLSNNNINIYVSDKSQIATEIVNGIKTEVKLECEELKTNVNDEESNESVECKNEPDDSSNTSEIVPEHIELDVEDIFNDDNIIDISKLKQVLNQNEENDEHSLSSIKQETIDNEAENDIAEIDSQDNDDQQEHSTTKTYPCQFCDKVLLQEVNYENHLLRCHQKLIKNNIEKFISRKIQKCDLCQFQTILLSRLTYHYNAVHNDSKFKLKCKHCNRTFVRKLSLEDHLLKIHPEFTSSNKEFIKSKIHKCQLCSFETTLITTFRSHMSMVHDKYESHLQCMFCPKKFMSKIDFDNHLIKQHKKHIDKKLKEFITSKIYNCTECSFETTHKRKLKIHFKNMHTDNKPRISCEFCSKTFVKKVSLSDHALKHHKNEIKNNLEYYVVGNIYKCNSCSYETAEKFNLTNHLKQHIEFKIKCRYCDKTFVHKFSLDDHILKQHKTELNDNSYNVITTKVHKCTFCDYQTTRKFFFNNHVKKIHSKVKLKMSCEFCIKTFAYKSSLNTHLLKVHKEKIVHDLEHFITSKIYKCDFCDYQTAMIIDLRRHLATHGAQSNPK